MRAPEQQRALSERHPTMVWRTDARGMRDDVNPACVAFTGRRVEELLGDAWHDLVHPEDLGDYRRVHASALAARGAFELRYRLRGADGRHRPVLERGTPYRDAAGGFAGFVGTCVELPDDDAREVSSPADELFEMSLDCLCVVGFDGYLRRVNPSWTRVLGWAPEELMSRPSEEFLHPEDRARTLAGRGRLHAGAPLGPLVNRYRCKDGSYRWFEWRSVARLDRGLVYAAARDVTEQQVAQEELSRAREHQARLERQLVLAERMASMGRLAAGVAHEVNNPLAYAMANVALLGEDLARLAADGVAPARVAELAALVRDAGEGLERVRKIVAGLKTFARADEERRADVDVGVVLDRALAMVANEIRHRARLVKQFRPTPPVHADEARLDQVFVNLLVNAAQAFTDAEAPGNEIRVRTGTDARGRVEVAIVDTGPGIAPEARARLFEPFFTTKPAGAGTGLGLSISHEIVSALGGEIVVDSEEGRGTTVRVLLPASTATAPSPAHGASVAEPTASLAPVAADPPSARVLVIDDEPAVGLALKRILRDHQVTNVASPRRALDLLRRGACFDVIFSDLMMPEMSGMELLGELERAFPELARRVVFLTGGTFTPAANAFVETTANAIIHKPFEPETIRAAVSLALRHAG